MKKISKTCGQAAIFTGIGLFGAAAGVSVYMERYALSRNFFLHKMHGNKTEAESDPLVEFLKPGREWIKREAESVTIFNRENKKLHGLYLPGIQAGSHRFMILCHGYRNDCSELGLYAKHFWNRGYSVLLPDARGHGESEGSYIGMGWQDRKDLLKWIDFLKEKDPKAQIVLMGISMGAAAVMMTAGEKLSPNVKAVIEDSGYTSVWEEFACHIKTFFHLPSFPFLPLASLVSRICNGYSFKEANAMRQLDHCTIPILFIHGAKDTFVPFYMLNKLYHAAHCEKAKLVVDHAGHARCCLTDPELYFKTTDRFLDKYII